MPDLVADDGFARNAAPAGRFEPHAIERAWHLDRPVGVVWKWLNDPRTFTQTQVFPFRVEFIDDGQHDGMMPGTLNAHHGPLMSFHGVVGDVVPPDDDGRNGYRDLQYAYGSYWLSMRVVRPTRLQFWLDATGQGQCDLRMRLDSFVRPWIRGVWTRGNAVFWSRFPKWAMRSTRGDA